MKKQALCVLLLSCLGLVSSLGAMDRVVSSLRPIDELVFGSDAKEITASIAALKCASEKGAALENIFLYGQSMVMMAQVAETTAHEAGLTYRYISAHELGHLDTEGKIKYISEIVNSAQTLPKKLMIIVDNGALLLKSREQCSAQEAAVLNYIISCFGQHVDHMFMVLAQRPDQVDEVVIRRFGICLLIKESDGHKAVTDQDCFTILRTYRDKILKDGVNPSEKPSKLSLQYWFGNSNDSIMVPVVEEELFQTKLLSAYLKNL